MGFSVGSASACNVENLSSIPGWEGLGRSLGDRNGHPLQYSCLGNLTDGGAWWMGFKEQDMPE